MLDVMKPSLTNCAKVRQWPAHGCERDITERGNSKPILLLETLQITINWDLNEIDSLIVIGPLKLLYRNNILPSHFVLINL